MEPFINEQSKCVTRCGHAICSECITQLQTPHCPLCRTPVWGARPESAEAALQGQIAADRRYAASLQDGQDAAPPEDEPAAGLGGGPVPLPFLHLPQQRAMTYASFSR
jgi:hypothetical protein